MLILKKVILVVSDGYTKELCIGAHLFAKEVLRLVRKSGPLFTALYLKQCAVCLQQAYGGDPWQPTLLPFPVALAGSGYPKIIPSFHRKMIRRKDDKADLLVKLNLSFFRLCRAAKRLSNRIVESIVSLPESKEKERLINNKV